MADWRVVVRGVAEPVVAPMPVRTEGVGGWTCGNPRVAGSKRTAVALWADSQCWEWTAVLAPGELSAAEQVAAERAAVVEHLRELRAFSRIEERAFDDAADAIERGEHRKGGGT